MEFEAWRLGVSLLVLLSNLIAMGAGGVAWMVSRRQARKAEVDAHFQRVHERIDQLHEAHASLRDRVSTNEATLERLPSSEAVSDLRVVVEELRGDVKALSTDLGGFKEMANVMRRQVELMDGYLREAGKKG